MDTNSREVEKLISALQWRIEKLHRRGTEVSREKAYNEAMDLISKLRGVTNTSEFHYLMHYTP
jgi:hypothetical protein